MPENILVERLEGGIGLIRINRPKRLNALNQATMTEIVEAVGELEADDEVRAIVLTGDERAFAAGADIGEMADATVPDMLAAYRFDQWETLRRRRKPMIAAVSGWALGGGCELAMLCDMIVASETARFGQPEVNLGIMPGAGGTQRLTRQVGPYLAMEMVLAGRNLTAEDARQHGLVNRVVPTEAYLDSAIELARTVASKAPLAVRLAREAVLKAQDASLEIGLAHERHNFYLLFGTADAHEGLRAFAEKRKPEWQGR